MKVKSNTFFCLVCLTAIIGCSGPKKTTPPIPRIRAEAIPDADSRVFGNPASTKREPSTTSLPSTDAGTWVYKETVSTTGTRMYMASILSDAILDFPAPFDGGSSVIMTLQKRNGSINLSLGVSKGQFTSSFQGGKVRIRFNNNPSDSYSFSAASNGATDIIFLDSLQPLIRKLKTARKTVISVGFYGQGTRQIAFRTAGLKWED